MDDEDPEILDYIKSIVSSFFKSKNKNGGMKKHTYIDTAESFRISVNNLIGKISKEYKK